MRTVLAEDLLFGRVDIAQPNVHEAVGSEQRLDPVELGEVGPGQAEQERDGTSVYVSRVCRLGCIDVLYGLCCMQVAGLGELAAILTW